jgi:hypothetical protein
MTDTYFVESVSESGEESEREFSSLEEARSYATSIEDIHTNIHIFNEEGYEVNR